MFGADGAIKTLSVSRTAEEFIKNLEDNLNGDTVYELVLQDKMKPVYLDKLLLPNV